MISIHKSKFYLSKEDITFTPYESFEELTKIDSLTDDGEEDDEPFVILENDFEIKKHDKFEHWVYFDGDEVLESNPLINRSNLHMNNDELRKINLERIQKYQMVRQLFKKNAQLEIEHQNFTKELDKFGQQLAILNEQIDLHCNYIENLTKQIENLIPTETLI